MTNKSDVVYLSELDYERVIENGSAFNCYVTRERVLKTDVCLTVTSSAVPSPADRVIGYVGDLSMRDLDRLNSAVIFPEPSEDTSIPLVRLK